MTLWPEPLSEAQWLLLFLAAALGGLPLFLSPQRAGSARLAVAVVLPLAVALAAAGWQTAQRRRMQAGAEVLAKLPREEPPTGFVSSDTCRACHPSQYASWHRSYHRTMTQYATPETVRADFNHVVLSHAGQVFTLQRRGEEFWVEMSKASWEWILPAGAPDSGRDAAGASARGWHRVGLLTGSHHMQFCWLPSGAGNRMAALPFVWLIEDRRWVPIDDTFLAAGRTGPAGYFWNANCINCHTTFGQPRPDRQSLAMDSRAVQLGIACEACHGPAEQHLARHRSPPRRWRAHWQEQPDTTIVNPARLPHTRASDVCGNCHSVKGTRDVEDWADHGFRFRPGDELDASSPVVRPTRLAEQPWVGARLKKEPTFLAGRFWPDGMVRVSGREYNGLVETPCYQRGQLSCLSCHSMHQSDPNDQLAPGMETDQACLQCHASFSTRLAEHTRHAPGSTGSRCYNCHMPHTTYGLLKAIRSHQIDSPSVAATRATGRPNACNLCHLDQTLEWSARHLSDWYGQPPVDLSPEERELSAAVRWLLSGDAGQRALLAWHAGWTPAREASGHKWLAPFLGQLLSDPYAAVRYIAWRSLRQDRAFGSLSYDYTGPPPQRATAREEVLARWTREVLPDIPRSNPALLLSSERGLDVERFHALLRQRDDRPINLQE